MQFPLLSSDTIRVKITPGSKKDEYIDTLPDGTLKIKIKATPTDGKANNGLIVFLKKNRRTMGNQKRIHKGTKNSHTKVTLFFTCFFIWNTLTTYFTYILRCADSTLYTGITTDIDRRIIEHNTDNKKGAKYTRVRRPVELLYFETFNTRSEACKREYSIKHMTRDEKLTLSEQSS